MALGLMSYEDATKEAENLNLSASKMDKEFDNLKREMDSLETVLKSRGADELYATYKVLESKIRNYSDKVRDFSSFLSSAVAQYKSDDEQLVKESRG